MRKMGRSAAAVVAWLALLPTLARADDAFWRPLERQTAIGQLDRVLRRIREPARYFPGVQPGQPPRIVFDADGVLFDGHDEWAEVAGAAHFVATCLAANPQLIVEVATAREIWHQQRTRDNMREALGLRAGGLEGGRVHVHYNKRQEQTASYKYHAMSRFAAEPGRVVAAFENTPANAIAWWHALRDAGQNDNVLHFLVTAQLHHPREGDQREIRDRGIELIKIDHYHGYARRRR